MIALRIGWQAVLLLLTALLVVLKYAGYLLAFGSGWGQSGLAATMLSTPPPRPEERHPDIYRELKRRR